MLRNSEAENVRHSELQGDGAANDVNIAVGGHVGLIAVVIHQGEVPVLELLVLIAHVESNRIGEQSGAIISGAQAQSEDNFVGVEVVDLRISSGLEGDSSKATPARTAKFLFSWYSAPRRGMRISSN